MPAARNAAAVTPSPGRSVRENVPSYTSARSARRAARLQDRLARADRARQLDGDRGAAFVRVGDVVAVDVHHSIPDPLRRGPGGRQAATHLGTDGHQPMRGRRGRRPLPDANARSRDCNTCRAGTRRRAAPTSGGPVRRLVRHRDGHRVCPPRAGTRIADCPGGDAARTSLSRPASWQAHRELSKGSHPGAAATLTSALRQADCACGTSASGRTFGGRPRLRFWATIFPCTNSSPPQTPHGSRRVDARRRGTSSSHRALQAERLGRGDVVELLGEEQLRHRARAVVAARELLPVRFSDRSSSVSKGWMANIATHSPLCLVCSVFVVRRRVVGSSVPGVRRSGQTKRPPGCPDGLVDRSLVAWCYGGDTRVRRGRPCFCAMAYRGKSATRRTRPAETEHGMERTHARVPGHALAWVAYVRFVIVDCLRSGLRSGTFETFIRPCRADAVN